MSENKHLFRYQKLLFWISEIVIFDIHNNCFRYQIKVLVFWISKIMTHQFVISKIVITDIRNSYFGYP